MHIVHNFPKFRREIIEAYSPDFILHILHFFFFVIEKSMKKKNIKIETFLSFFQVYNAMIFQLWETKRNTRLGESV